MIAAQRTGKEAALPEVPAAGVAAVEALSMVGLRALQCPAQRIRPIGDHNQMHMVGHQPVTREPRPWDQKPGLVSGEAVAHHVQAVAVAVGGQRGQVELAVLVD